MLNPVVCLLADETAKVATMGVAERIARLPLAWAVVLAALSVFLLLPPGGKRMRWLGSLLGLVSIGLFGWYGLSLGGWVEDLVFYVLAGVTVGAAAATITARSPVYCAVWFALVLLGTAGLFLYQGAQFLGVATVVVYAGAILVTFLFVLMLAQPGGDAYYDRMSWEPLLSAVAGAVMVGLLTGAILQSTGTSLLAQASEEEIKSEDDDSAAAKESSESLSTTEEAPAPAPEKPSTSEQPTELGKPPEPELPLEDEAEASSVAVAKEEPTSDMASEPEPAEVADSSEDAPLELPIPPGADQIALRAPGGVLNDDHVATLGQEMFSRRLIAVQVAGALLLAALVGAVAIVAQGKQLPPVDPHSHEHGSGTHV